jgi:hypothetical protein
MTKKNNKTQAKKAQKHKLGKATRMWKSCKNRSLESIKNTSVKKQQRCEQQEHNWEDEQMKLTHNYLKKRGT